LTDKNREKIPLGPAAGETAVYATSLILFLICGIWMPYRNFHLMEQRLGEAGSLPTSASRARDLTYALYNWQAFVIALFIILVIYFWWTSTWKPSMARRGTRFLLWCLPVALYALMIWILLNLSIPLKMIKETLSP